MAAVRRRVGGALVAVATVVGLAGVGVAAAPAASAATTGTVLHIAITNHRMYVDGPKTFPAGRVTLSVDAAGADRTVEIIRLHPGYSWTNFTSDIKVVNENLFAPGGNKNKGLKALNRAISHTTQYGGLSAPNGGVRIGSVLLTPPSNRYVLFDDSGNLPKSPVHLTVTSAAGPQTLPATSATVTAKSTRRFGGATVLPRNGNVKFVNQATNSPHMLVLQHVKDGTTRQQVIDSLSSNTQPDFVLPGEQATDIIGTGRAMTVHLQLPAGLYAEMCFFPDPKTGMIHAQMGMVRMVHVK